MSGRDPLVFERARVQQLLDSIERLAAGDPDMRLEFSPGHDELDAIAFGINVLVDELRWAQVRIHEAERMQAEERYALALRRADARFETAFHANPCAMAVVRLRDGRFQDVNASFERQTGYSRGDVIGCTVGEVGLWIDPADLADFRPPAPTTHHSGREVRFRTKIGTLATAVFSADVISFGGETCVLAAALDVTDRKNTERQAAILRDELAHRGRITMAETLTGSLSHEINQPLTAVIANAEAALRFLPVDSPALADVRDALTDIVTDATRAGDVVRRMRTLLKNGRTRHEVVEVNGSVSEVVKLVQGNANSRRIALEVELAPDLAPVTADRIQMQQVVLNLLLNAFDAVQDGEGRARAVRVQTVRRDGTAAIEVTDRGPGLGDDALARIFEPFYTTKQDGMGLGLSICQAIVGAHGGSLDARRNAGAGMTFSATFPFWTPDRRGERLAVASTPESVQ